MAAIPAKTHPADPVSRGEAIAQTLRDEILRGQYRPGERLPSERDLALRFSTGRGPVREALKRLDQLGIASIQQGGARAVAVEECTLDVLGPLLDLDDVPNPGLFDQMLQVLGVLTRVAARVAIRDATDEQMAEIRRRAALLLEEELDELGHHSAFRQFTNYLVAVSDHLVLKLILNGLRTTGLKRAKKYGIRIRFDSDAYKQIAVELCAAVDTRDYEKVGESMEKLNRLFRDSLKAAMEAHRAEWKSAND